MYYIGCDLGSTTGKVVIMDEQKNILASSIVRSARGPQKTMESALLKALSCMGAEKEDILSQAKVISTGYGRNNVEGVNQEISEISCHAKGACFLNNKARTIIDIGGQDCKIISVNAEGRVLDFQMNDKCSAGTGRFFEVMAKVLDTSLEELAKEAMKSEKPRQISRQCSVFAESEVISLVNNNVPLCDIAAGIHDSIARRIHGMACKVGIEEVVVLTGGCAQNEALRRALSKRLRTDMGILSENPQLAGAIGAALFAMEI